MSRTKRDIERDAADLRLKNCIISIYNDFKELDVSDMLQILGISITTESSMLRKHYKIEAKDEL